MSNIYTIKAGCPFADTLARSLLSDAGNCSDSQNLAHTQILLPTRRGIRNLQDSFVKHAPGSALLLPRLQTFGDIDEEDLTLSLMAHSDSDALADIPPAMPPLKRRILLARLIMGLETYRQGFDSALKLAAALGDFIDQLYIEELDFAALPDIVPQQELAAHWNITLKFLEILSESWPEILSTHGMIDAADRRSRLIRLLAGHWEENPPTHKIIAAGSTGSVPATARLMDVVSKLPDGHVILPGLDQDMSDEDWSAIEPSHAQYGLKQLLARLDCPRGAVKDWPATDTYGAHTARHKLMSLMLKPAASTTDWQNLNDNKDAQSEIKKALENVSYIPCETPQEEAQIIALALRDALENPQQTAALITPDRILARRVAAALQRWNIAIDDSAGQSLIHQPAGLFLRLVIETALTGFAPVTMLALLKHPLCLPEMAAADKAALVAQLEVTALRGLPPKTGIEGLAARLEAHNVTHTILPRLREAFAALNEVLAANSAPFDEILNAHITCAEILAGTDKLWRRTDGQSAAQFIAEMNGHSATIGIIAPGDYKAAFTELLSAVTLRPAYGTHPRLKILGQLEARLVQADIMILGGLNEGSWPADSGYDPWMSRPMRKEFGLPALERSVGLAAHDFCQVFCTPRIIMTRAKRVDGAASVPSRWLVRLETVMEAAGLSEAAFAPTPYKYWASSIDKAGTLSPVSRPEPAPPAAARPKALYATKIEKWLQDPYSIYAQYILKLRKKQPLEKDMDAADQGNLLHKILERYAAQNDELHDDPLAALCEIATQIIDEMDMTESLPGFWWPRFKKLSEFLIRHEDQWRKNAALAATEARGSIALQGAAFTLSAIADRIDRMNDGSYALIDYKSGGTYSAGKIKSGALPQLPLEGLILRGGGFDKIGKGRIGALSYWVLSGGREAGKIDTLDKDMDEVLQSTHDNLVALVNCFCDENTPYLSVPRAAHIPRFNDYEHLARIKEWSAQDDAEGEAT